MEEQVTKRWHLGLFSGLLPTCLSANGNVGSNFFWIFLKPAHVGSDFSWIFQNCTHSLSLSVADVFKCKWQGSEFFLKRGLSLSLSLSKKKGFNPSGALTIFGLFQLRKEAVREVMESRGFVFVRNVGPDDVYVKSWLWHRSGGMDSSKAKDVVSFLKFV